MKNATRKIAALVAGATAGVAGVYYVTTLPGGIFTDGFEAHVEPALCGQQQTGTVYYQVNSFAANVDITRFENIFGKLAANKPAVLFPGVNTSPYIKALGKQAFVAARFVMPALPLTARGKVSMGETFGGNPLTISISPHCGFTQAVDPKCIVHRTTTGQGVTWKPDGGTYAGVACPLTPGRTYFVNVQFEPAPPTGVSYNCSASACSAPFVNEAGNR